MTLFLTSFHRLFDLITEKFRRSQNKNLFSDVYGDIPRYSEKKSLIQYSDIPRYNIDNLRFKRFPGSHRNVRETLPNGACVNSKIALKQVWHKNHSSSHCKNLTRYYIQAHCRQKRHGSKKENGCNILINVGFDLDKRRRSCQFRLTSLTLNRSKQ